VRRQRPLLKYLEVEGPIDYTFSRGVAERLGPGEARVER
jgi:hypothetical protein